MGGNIFTVLNSRYKSNIYLPGIKNKEFLKRALKCDMGRLFYNKNSAVHIYAFEY